MLVDDDDSFFLQASPALLSRKPLQCPNDETNETFETSHDRKKHLLWFVFSEVRSLAQQHTKHHVTCLILTYLPVFDFNYSITISIIVVGAVSIQFSRIRATHSLSLSTLTEKAKDRYVDCLFSSYCTPSRLFHHITVLLASMIINVISSIRKALRNKNACIT